MRTAKRPLIQPVDIRPPLAISYIRFSTPEQRKGDSLRRQTEDTAKWCERNGIPLDLSLSCRDAGVSAYHGKHRSDKAALGGFLELVRQGKVPKGSFLIIENLDRLSREDERTALKLWIDILDAGVNIVQLHPETIFRHERSDMTDIIRAIIELARGHGESRIKSVRSLANWDKAFNLAREGKAQPPRRKDGKVTKAITNRLPGWIEEKDGQLQLIAEHAAVVKRIFEMSVAGYGMTSIVKKLTAEEVPAFGDRVPDSDGHTRRADGKPYGCGQWRTSYVRSILKDRRALGEFQPRDTDGKPYGDPIPGYYPFVVGEKEFYAARAATGGRKTKQGRIGNNVANLFGGLLKNARDGCTYYAATRSDNGCVSKVLLNQSSIEGRSKCYTFPYATFEKAILSQLREIDPADVLGQGDGPADATVLRGELDWVRERKAVMAAELLKGDVAVIAAALRGLEVREAELLEKLGEAEEKAVKPLTETWRDAKTLIEMLDNATDPEDVRLRLRAALRRIVQGIWLIVVPRGRVRLAQVMVAFTDGKQRSYFIVHRGSYGNQNAHRPGAWVVRSLLQPDAAEQGLPFLMEDLRDPDELAGVEAGLTAYPMDIVEQMLRTEGQPIPS